MKLRQVLTGMVLIASLIALGGCSTTGGGSETSANGFNLPEIRKGVVKPEQLPLALTKDTGESTEGGDFGETMSSPPVKDLTTTVDGGNPYLKDILTEKNLLAVPASKAGEGVLLNFDNADIYEVIHIITELLNISYIIDPQVKGVVNIRSGKKIPIDQLYVVFKKILNINGLDIRDEGDYRYIFPSAKPLAERVMGPGQADSLKDSPQVVIQVVPVQHIQAAEAIKLIKPYLSPQGVVESLESLNTIFVCDYESRVIDALMILSRIDQSPLTSLKVRLVRVDKAPLFDLRDELTEILTSLQVNKKGYEGVTVVALERVNSILLISSNQELLESATDWVAELDKVPSEGRDNIYIYNVRNSVASELTSLVNELIGEKGSGDSKKKAAKTITAPESKAVTAMTRASLGGVAQPTTPADLHTTPPATGGVQTQNIEPSSGLRFAGEPVLIADDSRNIILLRALPADNARLIKLLERLDNMPRQVLIEVMVAEVQLSDSWELGIEWALQDKGRLKIGGSQYNGNYISNSSQIGSDPVPQSLSSAAVGFTYSVLNNAGDAIGIMNAIASDNDVSILSSPQIMVLNNETATVNVGDQVPIVTTETINSSTGGSDTRTVQYRDTGVILSVTPKINYDGIIILDINQQVSTAVENNLSGISSPKISTRELKTKLAVRDGQTVFMGGLIENNINKVDSGIPILKDIPILGWLFKYQKDQKEKTELLVMITPYVIESEDVLGQYVKSFDGKMDELRKKLAGE
ncbi:MAG: type II secretion system secretin GspD [Proteobacteria bacterium]|nr:type II secretion system secretin GspD [Pseudomonadota bacterium]MBU1685933.1 type II secretion system secretin GspD [Pseudomonadota bacterium]